jgi:arylsulfatase
VCLVQLQLISPATAQAPAQKPNILFIMGDDVGCMQPSIYHRGPMVGETPNVLFATWHPGACGVPA